MTAAPTVSELVGQAQAAMMTFDRARAHQLLTDAIQRDPKNEDAWGLLSNVVQDPQDRRNCLERVLQINPHNISARKALAEIGNVQQAVVAPVKQSSALRTIFWLVVILFVGWCALSSMATSTRRSSASVVPVFFNVTYRVTGSTSSASLTYQNAQGGSEQHDVTLPWSTSLSVDRGDFLYLSAQNESSFGDVTCEILINNVPFKASSSTADYGIATCSGSAQ